MNMKTAGASAALAVFGLDKEAGSRLRKAVTFAEGQHGRMPSLSMFVDGVHAGSMAFSQPGVIQGAKLNPQFRGMGLGRKMYGEAMRRSPLNDAGRPAMMSDGSVSQEAQHLWRSLAKRKGYDVKPHPLSTSGEMGGEAFQHWDFDKINDAPSSAYSGKGLFSGSLPAQASLASTFKVAR